MGSGEIVAAAVLAAELGRRNPAWRH